jgi:hypothetical protein
VTSGLYFLRISGGMTFLPGPRRNLPFGNGLMSITQSISSLTSSVVRKERALIFVIHIIDAIIAEQNEVKVSILKRFERLGISDFKRDPCWAFYRAR